MANISVVEDNNHFPFEDNDEYIWARFMQASKMIKELMTIFLVTNLTLTPMRKYLSYKNVDKMKALLTELSYYQVI